MRFGFAIAALVLSGIFLVLGIGQRTFLAGPSEIVYSADITADSGFAVIPGDGLSAVSGQPNVVVTGKGAFAATGPSGDVAAWVAPFEHTVISVEALNSQLIVDDVDAVLPDPEASGDEGDETAGNGEGDEATAAQELLDPRGSDLWLEERSAPIADADASSGDSASSESATASSESATVRLPVDLDDDESVLIAVDRSSGSGGAASIVWVQDTRTPLAGPFLVAGGVFALVGLVLYLLAVDHDRRGLGPRRGRRGPLLGIRDSLTRRGRGAGSGRGTGSATPEASRSERVAIRRLALPSLGLAVMLGLSGCSASYWPDLSPAPTEEAEDEDGSAIAPIPVTRAQINRIVGDIAAVAAEGDDELDADSLKARFTGDALTQRTANYTIRAAVPDYAVVPPRITDKELGYELVQSTEGWPRTIFVTVESESGAAEEETSAEDETPAEGETSAEDDSAEDDSAETPDDVASPSLALILTQASPHENYLVSRVVSLRGGITMPEAAPAEEGTALLSDDLQTLALAPGEVGAAYAAVLAGGTDVEQAELFDLTGDTLIERSGAAWAAQSQTAADQAEQGVSYSVTAEQAGTRIISLSTGVGGALVATTVLEDRIEEPSSGRWKPTPPASVTALSGLSGQQDRLVSVVAHQLLFFVPSKSSSEPIQLLGFSSDLVEARN